MNRGLKITAAIVLAASLGFGAYEAYSAQLVGVQLSQVKKRTADSAVAFGGWQATGKDTQKALEEEEARTKSLQDASTARSEFDTALESVKGELNAASGRADISAEQQRIIAAQKQAIDHYSDAGVIRAQVAELNAVASELKAKSGGADRKAAPASSVVTAADKPSAPISAPRQVAAPATPAAPPAPVDWLADMRARLTAVGGGSAHLEEFDGNCSGVRAVACSFPGGLIKVSSEISSWSSAAKDTVLVHELAHQQQFPIMDQIKASAGYQSLFQSNVELLANCMATARGYTAHGVSCSQPQVEWARSIWNGVVPG